jgi:hypothetical protein
MGVRMTTENLLLPEIQTVKAIIAAASETLDLMQSKCEHPPETLRKEYKGNTGDYDPNDNRYWVEFKCWLCNKYWTADSKTDEYRNRRGMIHDKWHDEPRLG